MKRRRPPFGIARWNNLYHQAFIPPPFTFYPNSLFYEAEVKYNEDESRQSRRRFNKTLWEYIQKIVIPSLKLQNIQFNNTGRIYSTPVFIARKNMPKAHKIYKCPKCLMQSLKPFFDFEEIHPTNKFIHNCYFNQQQQQYNYNNDSQIQTLNLQKILLSIIDSRLKSENIPLKMIIIQEDIENSLALIILTFLFEIVGNEKRNNPLRWLFELLENERFVDLGEISPEHWAKRAYDNDDSNYSGKEEKLTKLEKEELKQFISITEGTFGLIKFKTDNNNKIIYTFCYLLFDNQKTIEK